ncbi:hypothetical protein WJR50_06785 [Catalinimonas sp. 4WD22]|uniref:hypothetical protein n=1 Tax=Catalinimonas locisalis TaxID=3133978 RepID=UPI00310161BA
MSVFTFHLTKTTVKSAIKALWAPPEAGKVPGLIHTECMTAMTLGSPIFSPSRILLRQIAVFAQWEDEAAIDNFLETNKFGKTLAKGWHTRLIYLRKWGHINEFEIPSKSKIIDEPDKPVIAVTLARMKLLQVPRFIHWGRPVEKLVRDHPGTSLSLAAIRLPRTVSTFSVWRSQQEMVDMVHGHSSVPQPKRHTKAMKERERKDFHFQFTTLRFKPIAEFGEWEGRTNIIPNLITTNQNEASLP